MANVSLMQQLQGYLEITNQRQQTIAANMANVDTPGYHTQDIDFQKALQNAVVEGKDASATPASIEVQGLNERPDGNNVSMDREGLNLAEAQLKFKTGVALLHQEYQRVMDAIHSDGK